LSAIKVGVISVIIGAIGVVAILVTPSWFPEDAAVQATRQDQLYLALMIMSSFIMAVVCTFMVYSIWKWRARPGDENRDGPPIHGNTTLEIAWTVIPTLLVVGFAIAAGVVLIKNETTYKDELVVRVTGQQFVWSFQYPNGVKSSVLVLKKGQPTQFDITSLEHDVIHSFYVPQFRVKADAVPGIMNHTYATPTKTGTFTLICTELCGAGHSLMRAVVRVMEPAQFDQWLSQQKAAQSSSGGA
jgi:cytochrome c oxidase subunit II